MAFFFWVSIPILTRTSRSADGTSMRTTTWQGGHKGLRNCTPTYKPFKQVLNHLITGMILQMLHPNPISAWWEPPKNPVASLCWLKMVSKQKWSSRLLIKSPNIQFQTSCVIHAVQVEFAHLWLVNCCRPYFLQDCWQWSSQRLRHCHKLWSWQMFLNTQTHYSVHNHA